MDKLQTSKLCVAAQLPPPINGLSTVNSHVVQALCGRISAQITDLSPAPGASGARKYAGRVVQALRAVRTLYSGGGTERRVLYMPSDGGIGMVANILIATAARLRGFSLYVHHHSFAYINRRSRLMEALLRLSPRRTCHVVLCEDMGEQLSRAYPGAWRRSQARLLVVSNAFLVPADQGQRLDAAPRPLTLCHISNLTVAKGAITFIELFRRLRGAGLDVRAKIAGPATEPQVQKALELAEAEDPGRFEWLGPVYGDAKAELLGAADVFVFPTAYANEAQPLVLLEALAAGLPILTIRRGCIGCDFDDGVGLIAESPETFHERAFEWVSLVAADPERLARYKSSAFATASAKRNEAVAQLETLLSEMTGLEA